MKHIYLLGLLFLLPAWLLGQDYFHRAYSFYGDQRNDGTDVHALEDGYLVLGKGICGESICTILAKLDLAGDTVWVKNFTEINGQVRRTAIQDSILYMPGQIRYADDTSDLNSYRLFRFNLDGEVIDSKAYDIHAYANPPVDSIIIYQPFGVIPYNDKLVVYGNLLEEQTPSAIYFSRGLMVWFNEDLSLDTMIYIQPRYNEVEIWDAEVDPEGLLTLLIDDDLIKNGTEQHIRRFEKYDQLGQF